MTDIGFQRETVTSPEAEFSDYFALLKPRVMSLVIFTAAVGLFVAPISVHPFLAFAAIVCVAVGAGASGALNMWWDADIDALMNRTKTRPVPDGRVAPQEALSIGLVLSGFSVVLLALFTNMLSAGLLAFTIFFYAVIYTMWLKRATPQNIVIGGAAGAFPPMIGWAIATGGIGVESILMFALIFFWTPPHFWALALFVKEDYHRAGVPMMTVAKGRAHTRYLVMVYTIILAPLAVALAFTSIGGWVYLATALVLNARFLFGSYLIMRRTEDAAIADGYKTEKRVFGQSIVYLFAHFAALFADAILGRLIDLPALPVWF